MNKIQKMFSVLTLILAGCTMDTQFTNNNEVNSELPYTFAQFSDIPIPENASMNLDRTTIFGRETDWVGKVVFSAPYDIGGVFDFYMSEMPNFGWHEITSVRGPNSVLTYNRDTRVVLIQITPSKFQGTNVVLTMSPAPNRKKDKQQEKTKTQISVVKQNTIKTQQPMSNNIATMPVTQSSLFVSPDAQKAMAGSLGLGDASNMYYKSNSNGVGQPPRF